MKDEKETLFNESRDKFMRLASYLDTELKRLYDDGVLTKIDWMKLVEDSKLSGQAVMNAINKTDYPPEIQKELVNNLIAQYEVSIEQILLEAKNRRYAIERIEEVINSFEKPVYSNWENALRTKTISQRQYQDVVNKVKTGHKDIINGIRSIPPKHPKKPEMIDSWIEEYQLQMKKLATPPPPQLSYAPSQDISSKQKKPLDTPQSKKSDSQVEKPKTDELDKSKATNKNLPLKEDEGIVDKLISWLWK